MRRQLGLAGLGIVAACSTAAAQNWAEKMFETTRHDFGAVARHAKTQFEFVLKNPWVEAVHIADVRSSCGCTTPTISKPWLKTHETGSIVATYNTHLFEGAKGATITVTFDKPFPAQVQLHVSGVIRGDFVFNPGSVDFGQVEEGTAVEKGVALGYSGRSDWKVTGARCANPALKARVVEHQRSFGQVVYHVFVRLDERASPGAIHERLILTTDDLSAPSVPLAVVGNVQPQSSVSAPASLFMGRVEPGETVTKVLPLKASKPFRVLSVKAEGAEVAFDLRGADVPKNIHMIPVTFKAGSNPGRVSKTIQIETDLGHKTRSLSAVADVAAR